MSVSSDEVVSGNQACCWIAVTCLLWRHSRTSLVCSQVWRWAQQYKSQLLGEPMPEMVALIGWLQSHIPAEDSDPSVTRISHGDYRRALTGKIQPSE